MELVCRFISVHLKRTKCVIIESYNAANYRNNLLPVMAPFLCARYGLTLDRIVHCETKDGKGPTDVHFATEMMHVERYIEEHKLDVVKPEDLVASIKHGEGMRGCAGEIFNVHEKSEQATTWLDALKVGVTRAPETTVERFDATGDGRKPKESEAVLEARNMRRSLAIIGRCNTIQ